MSEVVDRLTNPERLWSRSELLVRPSPVPTRAGIYAWYFRQPPPSVPTDRCHTLDGSTLMYVGISPKNGSSTQNLRKRITFHLRGNAEGSTLRLTLGVLLAHLSRSPLRRVGSGKRMTFTHAGEQWLDDWLQTNARVCWFEHSAPWEIEAGVLQALSLPLNLQDNRHHSFSVKLSEMRRAARTEALAMPIAQEGNQQRRSVVVAT